MMPVMAVTMGDPAGVGPEVTAKALDAPESFGQYRPIVIGDKGAMERAVRTTGSPSAVRSLAVLEDARLEPGLIEVLNLANVPENLPLGKVDARAGQAAYDYVRTGVELAMAGRIRAVVTAPINKEALRLAGCPFPGHTEILARLSGVERYAMMLSSRTLKVIHVTTHVSMRKACDLITKERLLEVMDLAHATLVSMGCSAPRIAVAGLNPHAGEAGMFGNEEIDHIAPAVADARGMGMDVTGPLPPDTVFYRAAAKGEFDIVVAMYHDQGHIPIKLLGFESAVNVTVGLPFIRTSVDHGTAFDLAGMGTADCSSMIEAIRLAARMSSVRLAEGR